MFKIVLKHPIFSYFTFSLSLLLLLIFTSIPSFNSLNNIVLDTLQTASNLQPRPEIVVIGIDDNSLQNIGAWPWNRDIFAKAFDNLNQAKPRVVGVDILFLETRQGDREFSDQLQKSDSAVIFGSKLEDGNLLSSIYNAPKVQSGLIDFEIDTDGKIRRIDLTQNTNNGCKPSFSLQIYQSFVGQNFNDKGQTKCSNPISVRGQDFPQNFQFSSVNKLNNQDSFKEYSFLDLYDNKIDKSNLEGKIVLIGSTARDLKNNLNDNFIDIFGRQSAGVFIHANSINSLLENRILNNFSYFNYATLLLLFSILSFGIYRILKKNYWEITFLVISLVLNNLLGIIIYNFGWNWLFIQSNLAIIFTYIYFVAFKYLVLQKEARFIENAFGKYVNPRLLQQLIHNPEQLQLGGQKKEITVLFSDIRGFTTMAENLSPEELINLINKYLEVMTSIILKNNGTIDKYIGDAIMAFWNAPLDEENHRKLAIKTALEMEEALKNFNQKEKLEMKIGVGLNTGQMIVGNVGSTNHFDYTLLGDNVNLGSRLEGLSKKYGVTTVVAEDTIKNLEIENMMFRQLDETSVKGKKMAIKIYEVLPKTPDNFKLVKTFHEGFALYQNGQFGVARKLFEKLENDPVSKIYIQRIDSLSMLQKTNWNGIWNWEEK